MTRYVRNPDVSETLVDEDVFLVHPTSGEIYHLERLGAGIWTLLREPHGRAEIEAVVADAFPDVPPARIEADLDGLLDDLLARGLIRPEHSED